MARRGAINPADITSVAGPVAIAAALTITMNVAAGLLTARLYGCGPQPAANIATTHLGRGESALILAVMAASAGLDGRLAPFIASYVLVLAVLSPRRRRALLKAAHSLLPEGRAQHAKAATEHADPAPDPPDTTASPSTGEINPAASSALSTERER
ncbi:hypothetical protein [Streptomyces aurantiogriseus]|uniref:Cation/H+ exchanger domain-containing protein n=1 Tax=Streptomyces aurantiogriseus TaxID=66870 RepID=A0A918FPD4_9ACTN|nr:hypothetical protein GCM10010251_96020 [Streptomyces aurantiogriseus]